jgi:hypothetical protein
MADPDETRRTRTDKTTLAGVVMYEIVQIAGSVVVLVAFILSQAGRLSPSGLKYLALNAAGSGVLAVVAVVGLEWGFLMLEAVWSLVSAVGVYRVLTGRRIPAAAH